MIVFPTYVILCSHWGPISATRKSSPTWAFVLTFNNLTYSQFTYASATAYLDQLLAILVPNSNVIGFLRCYALPNWTPNRCPVQHFLLRQ